MADSATGSPTGHTGRITSGPLAWELARFGTPLALGMALQNAFNLIDAYLIAQLPPTEVDAAVGAIGICDQVAALGTIISYGVSNAAATIIANRTGAGDKAGVQRAAWQSMLMVGVLSLVLGVGGGLGAGVIVRDVIGAKGEVADIATRYLRVGMLGSFSIYFLLQLTTIQRALGSAKTPVALLVLGNVLNLVLAVLFIFGPGPAPAWLHWSTELARAWGIPKMGMLGAAWASVIARVVVLLPNVIILARRFDVFPPKNALRFDGKEIRGIVDLAWPSSIQFVLRISAMLLVNSLVARYFTTAEDQTASTAMGLVFRLDTMTLFVAMGWGSAAQTFVGQNLGADQTSRARKSGWITSGYDAITNVLLVVLVFEWGEGLLRVFDDQTAPVAIALDYLHVVAPSYLALGTGIVLGNAMSGAGATRTTAIIDALVILAFQLPVCLVFGTGGSLHRLFQCVAVTNCVSAIAYAVVYARGGWLAARARIGAPRATPEATQEA